jgi:hypothetical protein
MAKGGGAAALVLGIVIAIGGYFAWSYYECGYIGSLYFCNIYSHPYRDVGMLGMVFGGVLFVVGIILLALPEKHPTSLMPSYPPPQAAYYRPPVAYYPPPTPLYPTPPPGQTTASRSARKFCPTCGAQYSMESKVCPKDASELKPVQ